MSYFCIFFFLIIGLSLYSRDKTFFSPAVSFTFLFVIIFYFLLHRVGMVCTKLQQKLIC